MSRMTCFRTPHSRATAIATLALLGGCVSQGGEVDGADGDDPALGESRAALTGLSNVTAHGTSAFASSTDEARNDTNEWRDVQRLFTGADSASGDTLEVTVTADVESAGSVWFRAVVDEQVALPSDVLFFRAGGAKRGTRSFTFVLPNVSAGYHLVRIQSFGRGSTVRTRSLAVRSASASTALARHAFTVPVSGPSVIKTTAGWANIPGLSYPITNALTSEIEATVSAEVGVNAGRMLFRVLVDGVPAQPGDFTVVQKGVSGSGARSVSFRVQNVPAGTHWVVAQWYTDAGGSVWIGDRTLSVFASRASSADGGAGSAAWETAPLTLGTGWGASIYANVHGGNDPGAVVRLLASAEVQRTSGSGAIFMRALVDGVVADPPEVRLDPEGSLTAQSFAFARRAFGASGNHAVTLQFRADAGTGAQVRDRVLVATGMRRTGGDFVGPEPHARRIVQRQGSFNLLTICFDAVRPTEPAFTEAQLRNVVDGADGMASIQGLIQQTTLGRQRIGSHRVVGCDPADRYLAPAERRGNWYWDNGDFNQMRLDALAAADRDVDFHAYDRNGDGKIGADELVVQICQPQNAPYGTAGRWATLPLDGGSPLSIEIVDCYMSTLPTRRAEQAGVLAHEFFHATIGAYDFYGEFPSFNPGTYSLMSAHWLGSHLDPYHKIHSGWLKPTLASADTWVTKDVPLPAVEDTGEALVLYRPSRNDREYFIVENRFTGSLRSGYNYDSRLSRSGAAIWHVIEDTTVAATTPPGVDPVAYAKAYAKHGWAVGGVRFLGVLSASETRDLKWADGTALGLQVTALDAGTNPVTVRVTKPRVTRWPVFEPRPVTVLAR